ncbi:elongator complex protein 6 [Hyperolius riggenbachi]|uniref:elongator complex protein 6 n=1 Tax=Hyperolius riggenbachi TaxID=752182 RepID=UPI0035A39DBB
MFPELQNLLSPERHQFTLITDWKTDGSFLVHHFLSHYLKSHYKVCFVALAQSFSHYSLIAQKLGVSLINARDQGQLVFLEGLKSYTSLLFSDTPEAESQNPLRFLRTSSDLQPLYDFVYAALTPSAGEEWKCSVLIVDDVGLLISLGVTTLQILDFIHYCRASVCCELQGDLVCLVRRDEEDEDSELLARSLCHQSGLILQAEGLSTGFCKDVHGQLTITHKKQNRSAIYQYKIQDKSVSFFAPGLSTAVL